MRTFFLLLCLFCAKSGFCQNHFALQNFSAFIQDTHVVLQWTMKQGNTCFGTGILRSDDNINFTEIGLITGICGSVDEPISFTFIDSFPIQNRTSYYKLVLGILGESQSIEVIYYDLQKENYIVIPNPVRGNSSRIIFSNEIPELSKILFFDAKGSQIFTSPLFLENYFDIPANEFPYTPASLLSFTVLNVKGEIISSGSFVYIP